MLSLLTNAEFIFISVIAILATGLLWLYFYTLFTTQSKTVVSALVSILIVFMMPGIFMLSTSSYIKINKWLFQSNESGEVRLAVSPMKIPDAINASSYCKQFINQSGQPINDLTVGDKSSYCGIYWPSNGAEDNLMIPYQLLPHGKAEYWASSSVRIIGKAPNFS